MRGVNVSVQTIRNRLNSRGFSARRPVKATPLTPRHRRVRQQWSRAHLRWTQQQWSTVLFTDESVFRLSRADGRTRVWRRKNERYANCNIVERDPYGGGALMVWAGISDNLKTDLVVINGTLTGQRYIDQVINPYVVPFFRGNRANFTLMDDNAVHIGQLLCETACNKLEFKLWIGHRAPQTLIPSNTHGMSLGGV